jgi:hypothetical protein
MKEEYLCAIGTTLSDKINYHEVGVLEQDDIFSFSNGPYARTQLAFNRELGSSITCVLKAKKIGDIELDYSAGEI